MFRNTYTIWNSRNIYIIYSKSIYNEIYKYDTRIRIAYIYSSIFINLCYRYDSIIQNNS